MGSLYQRAGVGTWYGKWTDENGAIKRKALSLNRTVAQQMLVEIERKTELAKVGITNPFEVHQGRPLTDHVEDWRASLQADGRNPRHVRLKVKQVADLIRRARFRFIADLSASTVQNILAKRRRDDGLSVQTSNHYLQAIKQFARWLVQDRRTPDSALVHLKGGNAKLDRRRQRRDASDAEIVELLAYTRSAGDFRCLTGADREALYLTAFYTGLRASELASLTRSSFDLGERPAVRVQAAYSKRRREDTVPLHPDAVARLAPWLAGKPKAGLLWPGTWAKGFASAKMFRADLAGARLAWLASSDSPEERSRRESSDVLGYTDSAGKVLDFHALRHTFISRIVRSGMPVKEAQTLARHSVVTLTLDRYTHISEADTARAMSAVPGLSGLELCTNLSPNLGTEGELLRVRESKPAKDYEQSDDSQTLSSTTIPSETRAKEAEGVRFELTVELPLRQFSSPLTSHVETPIFYGTSCTDTPTVCTKLSFVDGLSVIVERWPHLSEDERSAVLTIVYKNASKVTV